MAPGALNDAWIIHKFDQLDLHIHQGQGYGNFTNDDGTLAWAQSYLLEAYLDMYLGTKDQKYLDKFICQATAVMTTTDQARGLTDYRGRSRVGWSATKYTKNRERLVNIVHTGMIVYPLVQFSHLVKMDAGLRSQAALAGQFLALAEAAVGEFAPQWRDDPHTGEGTYVWEGDEPLQTDLGAPLPFNGPLALGRVLIVLYEVTGKRDYREKATGLARHFQHHLGLTPAGAYVWGYRPGLQKYPQIEDLSHGAIDVDFAVQAYRQGIVFTRTDMERFIRTLRGVRQGQGYAVYVDGRGTDASGRYRGAAGRWLELSEIDGTVYREVGDYLWDRVKDSRKEHPGVMLGLAKLVKYSKRGHE